MGKSEKRKETMQNLIVEKTVTQIREKGYEQITMEGIAKACGITKRTLYHHFKQKEIIIGKYIQQIFVNRQGEWIEEIARASSFESSVRYYLDQLINGVIREPIMFRHYLKYVMGRLVVDDETENNSSGIELLLDMILKKGKDEKVICTRLSKEMMEDLFVVAFIELTKCYYKDPVGFDIEQSLDICTQVFIGAVGERK